MLWFIHLFRFRNNIHLVDPVCHYFKLYCMRSTACFVFRSPVEAMGHWAKLPNHPNGPGKLGRLENHRTIRNRYDLRIQVDLGIVCVCVYVSEKKVLNGCTRIYLGYLQL